MLAIKGKSYIENILILQQANLEKILIKLKKLSLLTKNWPENSSELREIYIAINLGRSIQSLRFISSKSNDKMDLGTAG